MAQADPPAAKTARPNIRLLLLFAVCAIAVVGIAAAVITANTSDSKYAKTLPKTGASSGTSSGAGASSPIDGLTIFATFFVAAQGLERLLEPLSLVIFPKDKPTDDFYTKLDSAEAAVTKWAAVAADTTKSATDRLGAKTTAEAALDAAAKAKATLDGWHEYRVIGFWALASTLGMLASALLHLYFLRVVGITSASRGLEILATGLIIGAGTKPLHDLITAISAKAEQGKSGSDGATATATSP